MSLTVDGVWKVGVWATTVWGEGVWREGAPQPAPAIIYGGDEVEEHSKKRRAKERKLEEERRELIEGLLRGAYVEESLPAPVVAEVKEVAAPYVAKQAESVKVDWQLLLDQARDLERLLALADEYFMEQDEEDLLMML